ncbi:unnamed protein product, partial [Polarella glacialis]
VQYDSSLDSYVVRYISATQVTPEIIPREQEHRLRFCPPSARQRLRPFAAAPTAPAPPKQEGSAPEKQGSEGYPYKVLEGLDGLEAGVDVELQWKSAMCPWTCAKHTIERRWRPDSFGSSAPRTASSVRSYCRRPRWVTSW